MTETHRINNKSMIKILNLHRAVVQANSCLIKQVAPICPSIVREALKLILGEIAREVYPNVDIFACHPSNQPFSSTCTIQGHRGAGRWGERRSTPWTGHQSFDCHSCFRVNTKKQHISTNASCKVSAYPSCLRATSRVQPGQVANLSQG